jgi:hypothetical protein
MLKRALTVLMLAGFAGSAGMELGVQSAAAVTPAGYDPMVQLSHSYAVPAAWVYIPAKNGARYKAKRAGYGYYYGGYWYARPWWTVSVVAPVVVGPVVVYNPAIHGPRYRARRAGFGVYHGGYWYRRRWW